MARVAGIDLPKQKRIDIGLRYIYGIGPTTARRIVVEAQIGPGTRVKDLTESDVGRLNAILAREYKVEGDLRREVQQNIRRLIDVGSYRGLRHRRNLPCHGQRTRTNARTRRGRRKTVGSSRVAREKPAIAASTEVKKS